MDRTMAVLEVRRNEKLSLSNPAQQPAEPTEDWALKRVRTEQSHKQGRFSFLFPNRRRPQISHAEAPDLLPARCIRSDPMTRSQREACVQNPAALTKTVTRGRPQERRIKPKQTWMHLSFNSLKHIN